jgi:ribonuclease III
MIPQIKNKKLLEQAFIHRSYLNEAKKKIDSNERLEFLGDAILSFIVSKHLYDTYPNFNEGKLTNLRSLLVNTKSLATIAEGLKFGEDLVLSRGEEESGGRNNPTILANTFEAFVGALFLDQGAEAVKKFLDTILLPQADEHIKGRSLKDPKSLLQEKVQSQNQVSPVYKVLKEEGPAHKRKFTIGVYAGKNLLAKGEGKSKQQAEQNAASLAMSLNTKQTK